MVSLIIWVKALAGVHQFTEAGALVTGVYKTNDILNKRPILKKHM